MPQITTNEKAVEVKFEMKTFNISIQTDAIPELLKLSDPKFGERKKRLAKMSVAGMDQDFIKQARSGILARRNETVTNEHELFRGTIPAFGGKPMVEVV